MYKVVFGNSKRKIACNAFGWISVNRGLSQRERVFYSNSPGYQLPNIVQRWSKATGYLGTGQTVHVPFLTDSTDVRTLNIGWV